MNIKKSILTKLAFTAAVVGAALLASCSKDDNGNKEIPTTANSFFISAMGETDEYILLVDNVTAGEIHIDQNVYQLEATGGYTWIFNSEPSAAIGLYYNQGNPGVGLGFGVNADSTLKYLGNFQITSRFTSYGFYGGYAMTSVGGNTIVENGSTLTYPNGTEREDGVTFNFINLHTLRLTEKTIPTLNMVNEDGLQASFSGIVDMDDGTFLTGLVVSTAKDEDATGGSSTGEVLYPDSVWIARLDESLNVTHIYRDNRISYSSGRYRSQYYAQIGKADDGKIYVFSGSYDFNANATSRPCGALRIPSSSATDFDPSYYFNIEALSDGHRFRKVWHISGSYFLLEFYNHKGRLTNIDDPATQYAVVDMEGKTLKWVTGLPSLNQITGTGLPMAYDGKMYFPIVAESQDPTIYVINPATATATAGLSIRGASSIRAVGRLADI